MLTALMSTDTMLTAADYQPPRWLRNAHVQSYLGSSAMRRRA